ALPGYIAPAAIGIRVENAAQFSTLRGRIGCGSGRGGAFVLQRCVGRMAAHRVTALLGAGCAGVHLALADDLAVGGLEHEVVLAVAGLPDLERTVAHRVLAYRFDRSEEHTS